jgi:hypothetical protein
MNSDRLPDGIEPEFVTVPQTERISNLGRTKIYELIANGTLDSIKVGKRRLVRFRSIRSLGRAA